MDRRTLTILLLVGGVFFGFMFCGAMAAVVAAASAGSESGFPEPGERGRPKVGVVEIKGVIASADDTLKDIKRFREAKDIKAILVRVSSPGGAVAPSQEIHDAIMAANKKKPVVVSMADVAASGGYYLAVGAGKIYAEPGTLTGSIGVIAQLPEVDQLLDLSRIQMHTYRSGKLKDLGSPFRPPTEEDRKVLQSVIDDTYDQFLKAVADGRQLKVEEVRPYADGRVLTGQQAKAAKLIDELGGLEDAAEGALALAHVGGKPALIYPPEEFHFRLKYFLREGSQAIAEGVQRAFLGGHSGVYYLAPALESP
jgi:protease-4